MSAVKYLIPAMAVVGRAVGSSTCSAATTTISSAADASALSSCSTFTGSIAIATGTTDTIALDGITEIQGSLIAKNVTGITSLSADDLVTITDTMDLEDLTILTTLSFPSLTNVDTIDWNVLNALQSLSFGTDGVQYATTVSIQDTELTSLDGINLEEVDTILIAQNNYLDTISMQLANITTSLIVESNGDNVTLEFPNLIWAYNMTIRDVTTISIPSLASLNGSLGFYENDFTSVSAPNLTSVGGSLSFVDNDDLTSISMPVLKTIGGGFEIANNTDLATVDFPDLETIGGALDFYGAFTSVKLPDLTDVKGAFYLSSSKDITSSCDVFAKDHTTDGIIKGTYYCHGEESDPGSSSSTATGSSSSSTSTSSSSAADMKPFAYTGLIGVVAALFSMW